MVSEIWLGPESLIGQLVAPVQAASLLRSSAPTAVWQLITSAGFSQGRGSPQDWSWRLVRCIPSCRHLLLLNPSWSSSAQGWWGTTGLLEGRRQPPGPWPMRKP